MARRPLLCLARLEWDLGWHENAERLRGFIARTVGEKQDPGALSKAGASQTITGLRALAS